MSSATPTTAAQVGAEYAEQIHSEGAAVHGENFARTDASGDIPGGDYRWMCDNGIEPNAREYWGGYNARMAELSAPKFRADIIAERSAGRTALEIYEDDVLVWSVNYFADGASASWYRKGQRQIVDDAMACADWCDFEGGEVDEDGKPVQQDDCATSYVLMTYRPGEGWTTEVESLCDGQAETLIQTNRDRLPAAIVALLRDDA